MSHSCLSCSHEGLHILNSSSNFKRLHSIIQSSALNTFNQQSAAPRLVKFTVIQIIVITDSKIIKIYISDTEDNNRDYIKSNINSTEHKSLNNKQKIKMNQNINSNLNNNISFNIVE